MLKSLSMPLRQFLAWIENWIFMFGEQEVYTSCPYCGETISFLLEIYHGSQTYTEDCSVCCCPIELSYEVDHDQGVVGLQARRMS